MRTPLLALLLVPLLAMHAAAEELSARYDLSIRGITGGQITLGARMTDDAYSVASQAGATGLIGRLVRYGFEGRAQGRVAGDTLRSRTYTEVEVDDGERTVTETTFRDTRPVAVSVTPERAPEPWDIAPTEQAGMSDPLTALFSVMRPVPAREACAQVHDLFDGRHVSRLTLGPARARDGGGVVCDGEYRRLRGYEPRKMAEQPVVALTFLYAPTEDGRVQVDEIRSPTRFGDAVLRRR
ncbi:hypothetical protein JSE7799_02844 [Jannaschia seosinensis]|uniref:DUF3108 domain-containing protein n=1 Tax=Jannaschia seosinensis TaxID=313367 RepID=A0A0M7BFG8_9RHOB|nr:DUF3108 domain-containing protein [Jannaschia seosinensis]CUH40115.1 hypothetical protein JSE7799_02844 [Jannaschia seosinensis]